MSTHFWFRSGRYTLLAHLDAAPSRRIGIVMVPPFGWEDICSYRPLRFLARSLADAGIPVLRYDLPGTGDSSGDACDRGLFDAWIESAGDAAAELRQAAGVEQIAVFGIHLGAMIALAAASRGAKFDRLILWGAVARGRTLLRELRASANVERWESLQDPPPAPLAGLESGGFLMSPETVEALERLDLSTAPAPAARRILLLSRDELPHDAKLVESLRAWVETVELATGPGYSAMMAQPQEAAAPRQACARIAAFLEETETSASPVRLPARRPASTPEAIFSIEHSDAEMFGVLAEPAAHPADCGLVYLNAGGVRHVGPNRMWVESARRWAKRGIPSLRLDLLGIGESDGAEFLDIPALYQECLMEQIETAIGALRRRTGLRKFAVIGLCAGACWGFHAAIRHPQVTGAILLNPSLLYWDPSVDRRRMVKLISGGFNSWADCAGMIRSGLQRGDLQRGVKRVAERFRRKRAAAGVDLQLGFANLSEAWKHLDRSAKRVTLIFRDGEPLLEELEASRQLPPPGSAGLRYFRVANGGHTFRPLWAQQMAHEQIDLEIARILGEVPAPPEACSIAAGQPHHGNES